MSTDKEDREIGANRGGQPDTARIAHVKNNWLQRRSLVVAARALLLGILLLALVMGSGAIAGSLEQASKAVRPERTAQPLKAEQEGPTAPPQKADMPAPLAQPLQLVTVTIHEVHAWTCFDPPFCGNADFYSNMHINGWGVASRTIYDDDDIYPSWQHSRFVDPRSETVSIGIEIMDEDDFFDETADINPRLNWPSLSLSLWLAGCTYSGDSSGRCGVRDSSVGHENSDWRQAGIGYSIDVVQPDLIVESMTTDPANPAPGENTQATVTITNAGDLWVSDPNVHIYKDRDVPPLFGGGWIPDASCQTGDLAPGATATCTTNTISWPTPGTYQMWAQVDPHLSVTESTEWNNLLTQFIRVESVPQPDLVVQSIATNPVSPAPGEVTDVTVTVKNQGAGDTSNNFWVEFYENRPVPPTPYQDGDFRCPITGLAAGATTTCTDTVSYASADTYKMWAQVDSYEEVSESSETNNVFGAQDIVVADPPDLVVQSIATNPVSPARGQTTVVTVTVKNEGAGDTSNDFYVEFYGDRAVPPTPYQNGDFWCPIAGLAAGATATCTETVSFEETGTYKMWAQVDSYENVSESNETNNVFGPQEIEVLVTTPVLENITFASNTDGRLEFFIRYAGSADSLWQNFQLAPNDGWSGWADFGGPAGSDPVVGQNSDGLLEVFAIGTDGALWHKKQGASAWSAWSSLGKPGADLIGRLTVGQNSNGILEVFARRDDTSLHHIRQSAPGDWTLSSWATFGGPGTSDLTVAENSSGCLELFVRGLDGALWHTSQTSASSCASWTAWASLGKPSSGSLTSNIAAGRNADGRLEVFARGTDNIIHHTWQTIAGEWAGSAWWELAGGSAPQVTTDPTAIENSDGRLEVFVRGADNALWHSWQLTPGGSWAGWASLGGDLVSNVAVERNEDGRLEAIATMADSAYWQMWQTSPGGAWSSWAPLGVPGQPDLLVESITTDPASPASGENVEVTVRVKNDGSTISPGFDIDFYKDLSVGPTPGEAGDFTCPLPFFYAYGFTFDCVGTVSYAGDGTYEMWAQVDRQDTVGESDEGNNTLGPQDIVVSPPLFTLGVTKAGTGQGTVTSNPSGIDCGPDCSELYVSGTPVELTATPDTGSTFASWSGDPDCSDGTVTMDTDKNCIATFDDATAPSIPQNVVATPTDVDAATLSWDASTDTGGSGVAGYKVYNTKTGVEVADVVASPVTFSALVADDHSYFVTAYDAAGNVSARSRFAAVSLPVRFSWQTVDILGNTFAANPAGATAKASFIFEGDAVTINYGCGLNTGIFEVSIDGAVVDTVDAYCSLPDFNAQETYATQPGGHTIEVRPAGNTNPSSSYYWTLIDGFEVAGQKYEETDGVSYTWQTVDILGSTFSANPAGATAYAAFTYVGDSVSINYGCGLNTGIFEVWMDAAVVEPVDAYCSPPDFDAQKTYLTTDDSHTITVRPTGDQNPSSSYYWTLIDSFEAGGITYQAQALPRSEAEPLDIPEGRLSKLLQRLPKPIRDRIEKRLEKAGGIASAETLSVLYGRKASFPRQ